MKIKEGCLAIVVDGDMKEKSPNIGKIVTVGKFIGKVPDFDYTDWWEVDKPMSACQRTKIIFMQREANLLPISGDENNENRTNKNKTRDKKTNPDCTTISRV